MPSGYSSPYGRVHNLRMTTESDIYSGNMPMDALSVGYLSYKDNVKEKMVLY